VIAVTVVLAAIFGAADQYVGSLSAHPWGADVSGLSAPWLVLPFVVGALQPNPRRAASLGLACTLAALTGYCLMTLSPVENAHLSLAGVVGFLRGGNDRWFIAGTVTGPLLAWLGYRWRSQRVLWIGLGLAVMVALEPLARVGYGNAIRSMPVWAGEIVAAAVMAVCFVGGFIRRRSSPASG
jgi:uncharacterized membrane protein (UPF0136 family)